MTGKEQSQAMEDITDAICNKQSRTMQEYVTERTGSEEQQEENPSLDIADGKGKAVVASNASGAPSVGQTHQLPQEARSLDPKRLKRLLDNRKSSLKCRMKKEQKRIELEDKCIKYTIDVRVLPIMIQYYYDRRKTLIKENDDLRRKFFSVMKEKHLTDAQADILRQDIEWLNQLYILQEERKTHQYQQRMPIDQNSQQEGLVFNQENRQLAKCQQQGLQADSQRQGLLTNQKSQQLGPPIKQRSQEQRSAVDHSLQ